MLQLCIIFCVWYIVRFNALLTDYSDVFLTVFWCSLLCIWSWLPCSPPFFRGDGDIFWKSWYVIFMLHLYGLLTNIFHLYWMIVFWYFVLTLWFMPLNIFVCRGCTLHYITLNILLLLFTVWTKLIALMHAFTTWRCWYCYGFKLNYMYMYFFFLKGIFF